MSGQIPRTASCRTQMPLCGRVATGTFGPALALRKPEGGTAVATCAGLSGSPGGCREGRVYALSPMTHTGTPKPGEMPCPPPHRGPTWRFSKCGPWTFCSGITCERVHLRVLRPRPGSAASQSLGPGSGVEISRAVFRHPAVCRRWVQEGDLLSQTPPAASFLLCVFGSVA